MLPVRRRWLMVLSRELQLLAGDLAGLAEGDRLTLLQKTRSRMPPPRGPIEVRLLEGLLSEAILRRHVSVRNATGERPVPSAPPHAIAARHTLETRFAEPWTLEKLARTVGRSRSELAADFRQSFASSIHRFLSAQRMRVACEMLSGSDTKVEAIALTVGYRSKKSFYVEFRRTFGITPSHFRKGVTNH